MKQHKAMDMSFWVLSGKVDSSNYKNWGYKREAKNADLSDEELEAKIYHVREIFRGSRGPLRTLGMIDLRGISNEIDKRLISRIKAEKGE
jgi:hypothetical protein